MPPSRTVRVFLSSTFRDFAEERDLLVRKVFPALRRKCRERQVELVDVDLRWGITEDEARQGKILPICLAEIDRSRPFFMGFLGERYGWMPEAGQYDLSLLLEQPWLEEHCGGKSVTELEILHGVLNNPAMENRAFFYFRDPAYSEKEGGAYLGEGPGERARLAALKDRIRQSGFPVVENYASPGELAERVREDLWRLIDDAYPESEVPDALTRERMTHEAYGASRLGLYLGGEIYFAALDAAMAVEPFRPVLIRGRSGGGKSALLANWVAGWSDRHPETSVIVHHLGCGADVADPFRMAVRLMREIARLTGEEFQPEPDPEKQLEQLPSWLEIASAWAQRTSRELRLVLDGLDKVSALANLRWFPGVLPPGVKLVASCLDGAILEAAKSRLDWHELKVTPFTPDEQTRFIGEYLGRYCKALTPGQTKTLQDHPLSGNPLFLLMVLEELRVFGVHEALDSRLHTLLSLPPSKAPGEAPTVDDVFEHVLERLEGDVGIEAVRRSMASVWASRPGLTEYDLQGATELTPATWATIRNSLDEGLTDLNGRLIFAHDYLRKAVEDRYLAAPEKQFNARLTLAKWFETQDPIKEVLKKLPHVRECNPDLPYGWLTHADFVRHSLGEADFTARELDDFWRINSPNVWCFLREQLGEQELANRFLKGASFASATPGMNPVYFAGLALTLRIFLKDQGWTIYRDAARVAVYGVGFSGFLSDLPQRVVAGESWEETAGLLYFVNQFLERWGDREEFASLLDSIETHLLNGRKLQTTGGGDYENLSWLSNRIIEEVSDFGVFRSMSQHACKIDDFEEARGFMRRHLELNPNEKPEILNDEGFSGIRSFVETL